MLINICTVRVWRTRPDSFQWCPATGQGATGTNWGTGSSIWTWGRPSSLWGWWRTGPGCPGRLWSLLLWRYSRPAWTRSGATCSGWPCFGRRVGLGDPQRSLPTLTILWNSVILWFLHPNAVPWIVPCWVKQLYLSVSHSVVAASWKAAALVISGACCSHWSRGRLCSGPQLVRRVLRCRRNARFVCSRAAVAPVLPPSLLCRLVLQNSM